MAWWQILLIVLGSIAAFVLLVYILLFIVYITNTDSKVLAWWQKHLLTKYDKRKRNRHIE